MNGHYPHEPVITELQGRITKAEAALRDKEEENVMLKQQLEQYERKWLEYEAKMKSMEEAWKRQLSSLQVIIYVDYFYVCLYVQRIDQHILATWIHVLKNDRLQHNLLKGWHMNIFKKFSSCVIQTKEQLLWYWILRYLSSVEARITDRLEDTE